MCTQLSKSGGISMPTQSIGIRELRENLAEVLLNATGPLQITRHGEPIGLFMPSYKKPTTVKFKKPTAAQIGTLNNTWLKIQEEMKRLGVTEEDIISDLEELHRIRKAQRSA
jgi:antitoxin (DNA-binding transcriptional repressor) of toxin-antitoxin stability system